MLHLTSLTDASCVLRNDVDSLTLAGCGRAISTITTWPNFALVMDFASPHLFVAMVQKPWCSRLEQGQLMDFVLAVLMLAIYGLAFWLQRSRITIHAITALAGCAPLIHTRTISPSFFTDFVTAHYPKAHVILSCSKIFCGIHIALPDVKGDFGMETIGTKDPVKSSSQSVGIDWPVLTYWVTSLASYSASFTP